MSDVRTCIFTEKSILAEYHMTTSEKKGIIGGTLARGDLQVYGHNSPTPLRPASVVSLDVQNIIPMLNPCVARGEEAAAMAARRG